MRVRRVAPEQRAPKLCGERGASAVEFAIVASLLLMILFGTVQFGIAFNRTQGLNAAAREGARVAIIGAPEADVVTRVTQAQSLFVASDVRVSIDYSLDDGTTWTSVCNDPNSGTRDCTDTTAKICDAAPSTGYFIRVTAHVIASNKYAIAIPLWAKILPNYQGVGSFRCENV